MILLSTTINHAPSGRVRSEVEMTVGPMSFLEEDADAEAQLNEDLTLPCGVLIPKGLDMTRSY